MAKVIYEDGQPVLRVDWWPDDIRGQAHEMDVEITHEEVVKVMHLLAKTHDSCVGVNWDVINSAIEIVKGEQL